MSRPIIFTAITYNFTEICFSSGSNEDFSNFGKQVDDNMSTLNSRIQKLKVHSFDILICAICSLVVSLQEREANPILRLQDTVADSVEPLKRESSRVAQKIPDPRDMMPSTLPKVVIFPTQTDVYHCSLFEVCKHSIPT